MVLPENADVSDDTWNEQKMSEKYGERELSIKLSITHTAAPSWLKLRLFYLKKPDWGYFCSYSGGIHRVTSVQTEDFNKS